MHTRQDAVPANMFKIWLFSGGKSVMDFHAGHNALPSKAGRRLKELIQRPE